MTPVQYWKENDHYHEFYKGHALARYKLWEALIPSDVNTVLEVGCSIGMNLSELEKIGLTASGIEVNKSAADYARTRGLKVDVYSVPPIKEKDESYDYVMSIGVIMHNHLAAREIIKEMQRVSRKYVCIGEVESETIKEFCGGLLVFDKYGKIAEDVTGMRVIRSFDWVDNLPNNEEVIYFTVLEKHWNPEVPKP